jgi:hypothetical protein
VDPQHDEVFDVELVVRGSTAPPTQVRSARPRDTDPAQAATPPRPQRSGKAGRPVPTRVS